jgi:hypothetical protein
METSRSANAPEVRLGGDDRAPNELTLVEIAERLERVTGAIEAERVREREARRDYKTIAEATELRIKQIRETAQSLVQEQRRRMASFDGMFSGQQGALKEVKPRGSDRGSASPAGRLSITDAVLKVWSLDQYDEPLTTEEIAQALREVGYSTKAAPRSIKSTLNQALAKLCRERKVRRFRTDGTEIPPEDSYSRARKYMAAEDQT